MRVSSYIYPYIFFSDGVGDCFFNLPTLRALAEIFEGNLSLICTKDIGKLFFKHLPLKSIIEIPTVVSSNNRIEAIDICKKEIEICDLFIYLNPYFFEEILDLLHYLNPKTSIGYFNGFDILVNKNFNRHAIISTFDFASLLNDQMSIYDYVYLPQLNHDHKDIAKKIRESIPIETKLIIIHPDTTKDYKTWNYENYVPLFDLILETFEECIIMIVGRQVLNYGNCRNKDRVFSAVDLPIEITFDLVQTADFFIGIDSCFLHAADFFRIPSVGIFCNYYTSIRYGLFLTTHQHVVAEDEKISNIPPQSVFNAFKNLLH